MKKLLLALLFASVAQAQVVTIPDASFKSKLLASDPANHIAYGSGGYMKIDANNDGEIQLAEAAAVDSLNVGQSEIVALTGIAAFSNLKKLNCVSNSISVLDVSSLTGLRELDCGFNTISVLDVSPLINLTHLDCVHNSIGSLDVGPLTNLTYLDCITNEIASLDVSQLTSLTFLSCGQNPITVLDLENLVNLTSLVVPLCSLTTLDVSPLVNLTNLWIGNTGLEPVDISMLVNLSTLSLSEYHNPVLDVQNLTALTFVGMDLCDTETLDLSHAPLLNHVNIGECSALTTLILKNGGNVPSPVIYSCPNLTFVCANEANIVGTNTQIHGVGGNNPNVVVSSYCSFTPGGDYNAITGTVLFDGDNNGCDADDLPQPFIKVRIYDGEVSGSAFCSAEGTYAFYTQNGNFSVTPEIENPGFFNFSPVNAGVVFPVVDNSVSTNNFCITPNGIHPDVEVVLAPEFPARPGFDATYLIVYKNKGNQQLSGNILFSYDISALDFVSSSVIPSAQSENIISYNYSNLMPFESRRIEITLHVHAPTDTPPVNIDDVLSFSATANPVDADETPADNSFAFSQTVVGSYDPNEKICVEGNVAAPSEIGNYLHYIINFENTGSAEAQNIVVKDSINAAMFDVESLQVLNSSNNVTARINGNVAEFIFQGINLGIGGHGNILLKVKTKNDLVAGDVVSNKADIFFDYNYPIETNRADTAFQNLGIGEQQVDESISIYPNPSRNIINVKSSGTIRILQLFDIQGRLLQTSLSDGSFASMNISGRQSGIYFLRAVTENGIKTEKIIKN